MGRWHAHYVRRAGAEVAAIVDPNPRAAAGLRKRHRRARTFGDLADCLDACPADVVHVCTGLESHVRLAESALRAGKHVVVEKPFAPSVREAERLLALARAQARQISVVHQFPFQRGVQRVRRRLGSLGELVQVTYRACSAGGGPVGGDRRRVLLEILPHPFSLFRALAGGEMDSGSWRIGRFTDSELEAACTRSATSFRVLISLRGRPTRNELTLVGTRGTAHVNLFHGYAVFEAGAVSRRDKLLQPFRFGFRVLFAAGVNLLGRALRGEPAYPGLRELLGAFYEAITAGGPAPVSAEEIVASIAFLDRVRSLAPAGSTRPPAKPLAGGLLAKQLGP
jgi:predicted dehydrogenase